MYAYGGHAHGTRATTSAQLAVPLLVLEARALAASAGADEAHAVVPFASSHRRQAVRTAGGGPVEGAATNGSHARSSEMRVRTPRPAESLSAHHLLRRRPHAPPIEFGRRASVFWLLVTASLLVFRVAHTLVQGAAPPALANGTAQTIALVVALVSVVGLIFSYLLLYIGRTTTELRHQADRDALTGVYNRRAFELHAERQIALARTWRRPLAVLLMDGDGFKRINDEWGHDAGDEALRTIADALRSSLRTQDVLARIGGDEFAVLLPDMNEDGARRLAQRLGAAVATAPFPYPADLSMSFGSSVLDRENSDLRGLLVRADRALYERKRDRRAETSDPM